MIYRVAGQGPPVVLIHGMLNSSSHWRSVALSLANDFTVIAPRLPDFPVTGGHTEISWLRELVARKAPARYGAPGRERC